MRRRRVLVVDDDAGVLEAIKIILRNSGFRVKVMSKTNKFEEVMGKFKPELVLLDIWMPMLSGVELCMMLKDSDKFKNIPVVLLSASNRVKKISKKCRADDYLTKPFDMEALIKVIKKNLD